MDALSQEVDTISAAVVLPDSGHRTKTVLADLSSGAVSKGAVHSNTVMISGQYDVMHGHSWSQAAPHIKVSIRKESVKEREKINVKVKTSSSKDPVDITIQPTSYVEDLKEKVAKETPEHINNFYLKFGDKKLDEQRPISYYGLNNGCSVDVNYKNSRGG